MPPDATYQFKHALIRDAAYAALLRSRRKELHSRIAEVLSQHFPEKVTSTPELLAHHYTEAGLIAQAIPYWQRAGEQANQRSAYREAVSHLSKALELLKALPDNPERVQQELTLQLALSDALLPVKGHAAPEVGKTYSRARELCQQLGETPDQIASSSSQLFSVRFRLFVFYFNRSELPTAWELAEQCMSLAQSARDPYLLSVAHMPLGCTLFWLGDLVAARTHFEQAIALYDPQTRLRSTAAMYYDPRWLCRCYGSLALWGLGYPAQALKMNSEALAFANGLSDPLVRAETLHFAALLHSLCHEKQGTRERAEAEMTLSTEQGFPYMLEAGKVFRGWALTEEGQSETGIAQMQQGLAAWRATGAVGGTTKYLSLLADAYGKAGQTEEGLAIVAEALDFVDNRGERVLEAELYRLKGTLTLQSTLSSSGSRSEAEAEGYFSKAIQIARRQQAKSLELRAVMSLSRLWQQQGKKEEARNLLAEINNWFTEGFDTPDLKEAKALLDELSA
jgi:predicted ATPase